MYRLGRDKGKGGERERKRNERTVYVRKLLNNICHCDLNNFNGTCIITTLRFATADSETSVSVKVKKPIAESSKEVYQPFPELFAVIEGLKA